MISDFISHGTTALLFTAVGFLMALVLGDLVRAGLGKALDWALEPPPPGIESRDIGY